LISLITAAAAGSTSRASAYRRSIMKIGMALLLARLGLDEAETYAPEAGSGHGGRPLVLTRHT
jgi:hypothetical protein